MNGQTDMSSPKVNIASLIQKGNDLAVVCRRDRGELEAYGLDWTDVEELTRLVGECSQADAQWKAAKMSDTTARENLDEYAGECRRFRNHIIRQFRYGNEKRDAGNPIPKFIKNGSKADLVQDLHDCYVLCRTFTEKSGGKSNIDPGPGPEALKRSQTLSEMHVSVVLARNTSNDLKLQRNILCNRMKVLIRIIAAHGRETFCNDPRKRNYHCGF